MNIDEFDWGALSNTWMKPIISEEIFVNNIYEKFFSVEKDDVVVDIGASAGPFTYSILDKGPKQVFCIEPSKNLFPTLLKNVQNDSVTCINKGIANKNGLTTLSCIYGETINNNIEYESFTFNKFIDDYNIKKIDFLKIDCEGGEYDIFNEENFEWISKNVKKIVAEFHICSVEQKEKINKFRDIYLKYFTNYEVYSTNTPAADVKWSLWNDPKLWGMITIYIDNR